MKRTTIFIDEGLEAELQAMARKQQRPVAVVVREALEQHVKAQNVMPVEELGFFAAGRGGRRDVADRHEALLFRRMRAHSGHARRRTRR
jgi:hypothetical protein